MKARDPDGVEYTVAIEVGPFIYIRVKLGVIVDIDPLIDDFRGDRKLRESNRGEGGSGWPRLRLGVCNLKSAGA